MMSTPLLNGVSAGGNLLDQQVFFGSDKQAPCGKEAGNSGNVRRIVDNLYAPAEQTFQYDALDRITEASDLQAIYHHSYSYDSFERCSCTIISA
jgi:hypothetical protein